MNNSGEKRLLVKRNHGKGGMFYLTPLSPRDLSEISEESFDLPFLDPSTSTLCNSCGGLLFFIDYPGTVGYLYTGHGYLCNPTTQQVQIIPSKEASPSPDYVNILLGGCVGYDSKSDDYKILGIWERNYRPSGPAIRTFELYSLRNNSWKEIPTLTAFMAKMLRCGIEKIIYVRGKCYWLCATASGVMSFDYSEESFSYLPLPRKAHIFRFSLVKFNDEDLLGMVYCGRRGDSELGYYFQAWVWREGWDNMFCVSLGGAVDEVEGTIYGGFLFLRGASVDVEQRRLVVYDWTKKECKELGIYNYHNIIDVFCYVESPVCMPHGMPISGFPILTCGDLAGGFPILTYGDLGKDEHEYTCEYDSMEEHNYEVYNSSDEACDADLDDFAANGFRVLDDKELEEEEEEEEDEEEWRYDAVMEVMELEPQEAEVVHNSFLPGGTQHYYTLPSYENPDTARAENPDAQGNMIISRDEYKRVDFHMVNYMDVKFFVIKSESEDDVHKSIMYNMWSCSPYGNKKLNDAYKDSQRIAAGFPLICPIFLFFFVNMSGQFRGMAEMTGPVDFHRDMDLDKRSGSFPVKWHFIKDLSDLDSFHTLSQNNSDNRDIQRISYCKGGSMLEIFKGNKA
ncbi:uncharacterized protein LOC131015553 isoform X2 [Salvia miltiorrhiza]|uniref:uncharacterized protein LOC131015553 isoform X2 n=1 Tax=Salvia miltiorrhiza TaxID=226208 RepID=UPI0025AC2748|nr:uncharacterized protein LOC131015553 isoform X2 [Salvia miltiorrhiza]